MARPARTLTPDQRDRVAVILYSEIALWVDRFGVDLVDQVLATVKGEGRPSPDPDPPAAAVVLPFPSSTASPTDALASDR